MYKTKIKKLCIVMEYSDGGSLADLIESRIEAADRQEDHPYLTEDEILDFFCQMCLALKHVHDRKTLHRDLKPSNVFLTKAGMIKLGDFGLSCVLNNTKSKVHGMIGTPYYISPEMLYGEKVDFKSDIWAMGVILYEMCALHPPFMGSTYCKLAKRIAQCDKYLELPKHMPQSVADIVSRLLQKKPADRPNINELLGFDAVARRIPKLLTRRVFVEEFSHTVLHNQHIFQKLTAESLKMVPEEEESDVLMRWANGSFKPINGLSPIIFDYAMQQYMNHLSDSLKLKSGDGNKAFLDMFY